MVSQNYSLCETTRVLCSCFICVRNRWESTSITPGMNDCESNVLAIKFVILHLSVTDLHIYGHSVHCNRLTQTGEISIFLTYLGCVQSNFYWIYSVEIWNQRDFSSVSPDFHEPAIFVCLASKMNFQRQQNRPRTMVKCAAGLKAFGLVYTCA